jgi:hypothetical protein
MFGTLLSNIPDYLSSGTTTGASGATTGVYNASPITTALPYSIASTITISNNMNRVNNQFVAIFKIERNDKNEITSAKFIKEMWIETKNGSSVDFEVAKDAEISKYKADEISIRTIYTITF